VRSVRIHGLSQFLGKFKSLLRKYLNTLFISKKNLREQSKVPEGNRYPI